jgi:hypothetical protein
LYFGDICENLASTVIVKKWKLNVKVKRKTNKKYE